MYLSQIEAIDFRNLSGGIEFSPGLNVLFGPNAQGKTSWLEAVYVLGTTKSFKTGHPREAINHDREEAVLRGTVECGNLSRGIQLLLGRSTKQTFVNGKREAVGRYLGILDAIAFTAAEMEVIRGGPEHRRRFVDRGLVNTLPAYLSTLADYNRVLKQKNLLLRSASESDDQGKFVRMLEPWNDQLVRYGSEIHTARIGYLEKLKAAIRPDLFEHESLAVRYRSSLEGKGDLEDYPRLFQERLSHHLNHEIAAGHALVGPHRDDVEILIDGYDISRFGSSGQQRSALLNLELAQMVVYHQVLDDYPVFIVDDIDAELDRNRIEILLNSLRGNSQVFISTSKRAIAQHFSDRALLVQIGDGRALATAVQSR